jgi:hypothetical protein
MCFGQIHAAGGIWGLLREIQTYRISADERSSKVQQRFWALSTTLILCRSLVEEEEKVTLPVEPLFVLGAGEESLAMKSEVGQS